MKATVNSAGNNEGGCKMQGKKCPYCGKISYSAYEEAEVIRCPYCGREFPFNWEQELGFYSFLEKKRLK